MISGQLDIELCSLSAVLTGCEAKAELAGHDFIFSANYTKQ